MSTYEDADLAARFAALVPEPLPGDWDDVRGRAAARKEVRRRLGHLGALQGRRRRLVVVFAAVALVAVIAASALAVRAFIHDGGFASLPPVAARPSTPQKGVLVLKYSGRPELGPPRVIRVYIYADGRVVWHREGGPRSANGVRTGYLELRLTRAGVDLVLAKAESTGLVNRDRILRSAHGLAWGELEVRRGERLVRVRWLSHPSVRRGRVTPSAKQATALMQLTELVADLTARLPRSVWRVREVRAYIPSRYAICFWSWNRLDEFRADSRSIDPLRAVASLPARARDVLRGKRKSYPLAPCSEVITAEARVVEGALLEAGYERDVASPSGAPQLRHHGADARVPRVSFEPILPHGQWETGGG